MIRKLEEQVMHQVPIQRASDRLEKLTDKNVMKFNKGKCQNLCLERNYSMYEYTLGANRQEISFAKEDPAVLVDKLKIRQ